MTAENDIRSLLPSSCIVTIPDVEAHVQAATPRWSDSGLSHPYAVATPSSEADIIAIIAYTRTNKLKIIPANGGHGSYVPVNGGTIYLDMSSFKDVVLNETEEEVTIGGGCVTSEVLNQLTPKGWYTALPNSNAVGVIGAFIGGLSHSLNGKHGLGIDVVKSIRIIPFSSTEPLDIGPNSQGQEKELFNVLCGAGHGLGIITSVTLQAFPISNLSLTDNKIWTRRLIFPAPQISAAARLYTSFWPPHPKLVSVLIFLRAPPSAPRPGAPMIMLALSYFGPAEAAEKVTAKSFDEEFTSKAIVNMTVPIEWEKANDGSAPLNAHGGFKEYFSCYCKETSLGSIERTFGAWEKFTSKDLLGRGTSYVVIGSWSTEQMVAKGGQKDEKFFVARDRGIFVQCVPWYKDIGVKADADAFGNEVIDMLREQDRARGTKDWCFVNNIREGIDVGEIYTDEQIESIRAVKGIWDEEALGWNPVVEGW
ncbi:FAD-binding domain-containing protein [Amniculicola lignicola CBS 123094]|uniref:FAD-binding domain-containing protein n=1 Tax=Amniculicola lignicola CBS 123094 TaxID=1392246 RepID=A0A6A5VYY8_9PLEO|nr:FAD-binding domain-containing protein [Amniculicola lignicola CBS 123094]